MKKEENKILDMIFCKTICNYLKSINFKLSTSDLMTLFFYKYNTNYEVIRKAPSLFANIVNSEQMKDIHTILDNETTKLKIILNCCDDDTLVHYAITNEDCKTIIKSFETFSDVCDYLTSIDENKDIEIKCLNKNDIEEIVFGFNINTKSKFITDYNCNYLFYDNIVKRFDGQCENMSSILYNKYYYYIYIPSPYNKGDEIKTKYLKYKFVSNDDLTLRNLDVSCMVVNVYDYDEETNSYYDKEINELSIFDIVD